MKKAGLEAGSYQGGYQQPRATKDGFENAGFAAITKAACQLAEALKNSPEYAQLRNAKERLEQDELNKGVLRDLREQQMMLELSQLSGEDLDDKNRFFNELYMAVSLNPVVSDYLNAEYKFSKIVKELEEIFGEIISVSEDVDMKSNHSMVEYVS